MNKKIKIITYITNFVPELGFLTDQKKNFVAISHPSAELAAQKLLNHEEGDYLSGYIKIIDDDQVIVSEKEWTGELLETWADLSYIVLDRASEKKYPIELLDNPTKLYLVKEEKGYFFEIEKVTMENNKEFIQSSVIDTEKLLEAIYVSYKEFLTFCTERAVTFSAESLLHSSVQTLKCLQDKRA
ncbi:hypothetical protein [Bacillus sp. PK3_68]|uniref:hypothetical protein n=1 Tax=Bacillus sp. PK3_68 TaxID=2027408 RepID=UPI000E730179|nr:hypothetical protein [Bacillus sp. PK3_68]RJS60501.1 hypothetical protein CJ483_10810 [Bacillus sp. PK3_68]